MSETSGVPVTPEAAPADYMLRWQRHEAAQREAAAQNRRIVFATLALHGITHVKVSFNGEGDSGQIEDMIVTPGEQTNILQREIAMKTTSWPDADVAQESGPLSDAIENVCYDALAQTHGGWENNDGA